ncbi:hypothetical protein PG997_010002 [Apiospora hydei]|uniref:Uncharacterized protein n=1 Tax=Apiospora hydei TaxID=1337664 RepID=A0ABR1VVR6_9PEZI
MWPLIFLSLVLGLVAQAMTAMEEDFIPTPVDMHALPKMVQARGATPADNNNNGLTKIVPATFFYTLDNGTEFSFTGEPQVSLTPVLADGPLNPPNAALPDQATDLPRWQEPHGRLCQTLRGPSHEDDVAGIPVADDHAAASSRSERPLLVEREGTKSNTPAPGGNLVNCLDDFGKVTDWVECLIRDLVADDTRDSPTTVRVENGACSRVRCTGQGASLYWCNYSHHPKRTTLSTFSVPVADINAKCGGNMDDDGRGNVQGNAWNDYNHTMADSRVYVGQCSCWIASSKCGKNNGYLAPGYTSDTT